MVLVPSWWLGFGAGADPLHTGCSSNASVNATWKSKLPFATTTTAAGDGAGAGDAGADAGADADADKRVKVPFEWVGFLKDDGSQAARGVRHGT